MSRSNLRGEPGETVADRHVVVIELHRDRVPRLREGEIRHVDEARRRIDRLARMSFAAGWIDPVEIMNHTQLRPEFGGKPFEYAI